METDSDQAGKTCGPVAWTIGPTGWDGRRWKPVWANTCVGFSSVWQTGNSVGRGPDCRVDGFFRRVVSSGIPECGYGWKSPLPFPFMAGFHGTGCRKPGGTTLHRNRYRFVGAKYLNGTGSTATTIVDGRFDTAYPFKSFAGRSFIHICRKEAGRTKNFRIQGKRHRRAVCPSCRISCVLPPVSPS